MFGPAQKHLTFFQGFRGRANALTQYAATGDTALFRDGRGIGFRLITITGTNKNVWTVTTRYAVRGIPQGSAEPLGMHSFGIL